MIEKFPSKERLISIILRNSSREKGDVLIFEPEPKDQTHLLDIPYRNIVEFPLMTSVFEYAGKRINLYLEWLGIPGNNFASDDIRILKRTDYDKAFNEDKGKTEQSVGIYVSELGLSFLRYKSDRFKHQFEMAYTMVHEMVHSAMNGGIIQDNEVGKVLDEGTVELLTIDVMENYVFGGFDPRTKEYWEMKNMLNWVKETNSYRHEYEKVKKLQARYDEFKDFCRAACSGEADEAIEIYSYRFPKI